MVTGRSRKHAVHARGEACGDGDGDDDERGSVTDRGTRRCLGRCCDGWRLEGLAEKEAIDGDDEEEAQCHGGRCN